MAKFLCYLESPTFIYATAFLAASVAIVSAILKTCDACLLGGLPHSYPEGCELHQHGCYWCLRLILVYTFLCLIGPAAWRGTAVHRHNAKAVTESPNLLHSASLPVPEPEPENEPASLRPEQTPEAAIWRLPPELIHVARRTSRPQLSPHSASPAKQPNSRLESSIWSP
jgi:hypothetical protein